MTNPSIQTRAAYTAAFAALAASMIAIPCATAEPTITNLGAVTSTAINADGTTVAGNIGISAFRWTRDEGIQDIGAIGGAFFVRATSLNDDGTLVAGYSSSFGGYRAYLLNVATGLTDLGSLTGGSTFAYGVSGDGATVAGTGADAGGARAFRWRASEGGMVTLGVLPAGSSSLAYSVNTDGTVIAGSGDIVGGSHAFRWTSAAGMEDLGVPPVGGPAQSYGNAVSGDGLTVVGYIAYATPERNRASRWTAATGMADLGVLPGGVDSTAYSVSGDGSIVVGTSGSSNGDRGFVWMPTLGMVDLNIYFTAQGAETAGWSILGAAAISRDGTAITGAGTLDGQSRAFLVTGLPGCKPVVTMNSNAAAVCPGGAATFSITATGNGDFTYRWFRGAAPIDTNTYPSAATAELSLVGVQEGDAVAYRCTVTNACGTTTSAAARLFVDPADVGTAGGQQGRDGVHDNNDFIVFIDAFFNQLPASDLGSAGGVLGPDGQFDNNDFVVFIDQFFAAC